MPFYEQVSEIIGFQPNFNPSSNTSSLKRSLPSVSSDHSLDTDNSSIDDSIHVAVVKKKRVKVNDILEYMMERDKQVEKQRSDDMSSMKSMHNDRMSRIDKLIDVLRNN